MDFEGQKFEFGWLKSIRIREGCSCYKKRSKVGSLSHTFNIGVRATFAFKRPESWAGN